MHMRHSVGRFVDWKRLVETYFTSNDERERREGVAVLTEHLGPHVDGNYYGIYYGVTKEVVMAVGNFEVASLAAGSRGVLRDMFESASARLWAFKCVGFLNSESARKRFGCYIDSYLVGYSNKHDTDLSQILTAAIHALMRWTREDLAERGDALFDLLGYSDDVSVQKAALAAIPNLDPARIAAHADSVAAKLNVGDEELAMDALATLSRLAPEDLARHADAIMQASKVFPAHTGVKVRVLDTVARLTPAALALRCGAALVDILREPRDAGDREGEALMRTILQLPDSVLSPVVRLALSRGDVAHFDTRVLVCSSVSGRLGWFRLRARFRADRIVSFWNNAARVIELKRTQAAMLSSLSTVESSFGGFGEEGQGGPELQDSEDDVHTEDMNGEHGDVITLSEDDGDAKGTNGKNDDDTLLYNIMTHLITDSPPDTRLGEETVVDDVRFKTTTIIDGVNGGANCDGEVADDVNDGEAMANGVETPPAGGASVVKATGGAGDGHAPSDSSCSNPATLVKRYRKRVLPESFTRNLPASNVRRLMGQ